MFDFFTPCESVRHSGGDRLDSARLCMGGGPRPSSHYRRADAVSLLPVPVESVKKTEAAVYLVRGSDGLM